MPTTHADVTPIGSWQLQPPPDLGEPWHVPRAVVTVGELLGKHQRSPTRGGGHDSEPPVGDRPGASTRPPADSGSSRESSEPIRMLLGVLPDSFQLSPELALVDPELAARARNELGPPGAIARAAISACEEPTPAPEPVAPVPGSHSGHWVRASLRLARAGVVLGLFAFVAGSAHNPLAVQALPVPTPSRAPAHHSSLPAPAAGRATTRRFAWAPVPGASRYDIQLFRGGVAVFRTATSSPTVLVPTQWHYAGRVETLSPGDYRWYVWPIYPNNRRSETAVVSARLSID
jgi:hypothetical protein